MPGFPVLHKPEFAQTHVHWVGDAIQPSHPLSSIRGQTKEARTTTPQPLEWKWCASNYRIGLPRWLSGKESACNEEGTRDKGLIPRSGRSPGEGNGYPVPVQYSYLENSMDRGAWWSTVHVVKKSQTQLNMHTVKKWIFSMLYFSNVSYVFDK